MFVCFVKRSLGLHHAFQLQISIALSRLLWIFVHTPHALVSDIQDQRHYHWSLSEESSSLDNIIMVKFKCSRIFIQFKRPLNISKIIVFIFNETGDHISQMALILFLDGFIRSCSIAPFLNNSGTFIKWTSCHKALLASSTLNV